MSAQGQFWAGGFTDYTLPSLVDGMWAVFANVLDVQEMKLLVFSNYIQHVQTSVLYCIAGPAYMSGM